MESLKCQLNFKTSTQILTNQSQIQTKMQQETKSHPKHIVQTSTTWKVTKYGVISGPYFPAFGLNTERYFVSLRIQTEGGKIRTTITPNTDTFYAVNVKQFACVARVTSLRKFCKIHRKTIVMKLFVSKAAGY